MGEVSLYAEKLRKSRIAGADSNEPNEPESLSFVRPEYESSEFLIDPYFADFAHAAQGLGQPGIPSPSSTRTTDPVSLKSLNTMSAPAARS